MVRAAIGQSCNSGMFGYAGIFNSPLHQERVRPVLRAAQSFDRLRTNGVEGVRVVLTIPSKFKNGGKE